VREANGQLMLMHAASHSRDMWSWACRKVAAEIEHFKNEPVADVVRQDSRFANDARNQFDEIFGRKKVSGQIFILDIF
jgi:hypothetical protein